MRFRFNLRWIMLVIVCLSVGLAIGRQPATPNDADAVGSFGLMNGPELDWYFAGLSTITIAFMIGLWQQIHILGGRIREWTPEDQLSRAAYWFAIAWRVVVSGGLVACILGHLFSKYQVIQFEEWSGWLFYDDLFPEYAWMLLLFVVLATVPQRTRTQPRRRFRTISVTMAWLLGAILAVLLLPDIAFISWLVHLAIEGVNAANNLSGEDAFPSHAGEGFRVFWTAALAVSIVFGNLILLWLSSRREFRSRWRAVFCWSLLGLGILSTAGYATWFCQSEYARVSPFLATTELSSSLRDWCAGLFLIAIIVTAGAYRLSVTRPRNPKTNIHRDRSFFHLSLIWPLFMLTAIGMYLFEVGTFLNDTILTFGTLQFFELIISSMTWFPYYFQVAVLVLAISVLWKYFRHHELLRTITVREIQPSRFLGHWIALFLIAITGIPVIAIFCFTFWMGPWYRWPILDLGAPW